MEVNCPQGPNYPAGRASGAINQHFHGLFVKRLGPTTGNRLGPQLPRGEANYASGALWPSEASYLRGANHLRQKRWAIVSGRGKDPVPIPAAKITSRNGQKWKLHVGKEETAPQQPQRPFRIAGLRTRHARQRPHVYRREESGQHSKSQHSAETLPEG